MASEDPHALRRLAAEIATEAGALAAEGRTSVRLAGTKSTPTDVVTEMDRAVERLIRDRLHSVRPGDAVLGEEDGDTSGEGAVRWVVDPIDGTVNYLYGRPEWAVSIAAEIDGVPVAGAVEAPLRRESYSAVAGGGAWCNGEALHRSEVPALPFALVATGFGYDARRRARQAEVLGAVLPRVRDIRRAGCAALDLCAVAAGEADAYYERGLNHWDWAAAALVAWEAGVRVEGLHGVRPTAELTIAAPGDLFDELHALLESLGAAEDDDVP